MRAWLLALLTLVACAPIQDTRPRTAWETERPSTVVILDHLGGHGICSGVVIRDYGGRVVVATAAHCVSKRADPTDDDSPQIAELGQPVWFFVGSEWFPRTGVLRTYDPYRDRCTITAPDLPTPLPTRKLSATSWLVAEERFHAVSALYERTTTGVVTGETFADAGSFFWDSTLDIVHGWSGSPVMDSRGVVVGLVTRCRVPMLGPRSACVRDYAIFTDVL